jgi:predicted transcriptional regulator
MTKNNKNQIINNTENTIKKMNTVNNTIHESKLHSLIKQRKISDKLSKRNNIGERPSVVIRKKNTKKIIKMLYNLKHFKSIYKNFTNKEKETLQNYKYDGYKLINKYLFDDNKINELTINKFNFMNGIKKHLDENTKQLIDINSINIKNIQKYIEYFINKNIINNIITIDKIFTSDKLPKFTGDDVLYRGTRGHSVTNKKSKVGDELIFKNFMSTSTEISISTKFTNIFENIKENCCMYIFSGLKDVPYLYLPWSIIKPNRNISLYNVNSDEFEYLLPRGLKFKITKISKGIINTDMQEEVKHMTFDKLDKYISKNRMNTMNNDDLQKIINHIYKKIKVYNLEYIGKDENSEPIIPYVYKPNLKLTINIPEDKPNDDDDLY